MATTIATTPAIRANQPTYSAAVMLATTGYTSAMMPATTSSTPSARDQPGESVANGCEEVDMESLRQKQALPCADRNFSMASQAADTATIAAAGGDPAQGELNADAVGGEPEGWQRQDHAGDQHRGLAGGAQAARGARRFRSVAIDDRMAAAAAAPVSGDRQLDSQRGQGRVARAQPALVDPGYPRRVARRGAARRDASLRHAAHSCVAQRFRHGGDETFSRPDRRIQ